MSRANPPAEGPGAPPDLLSVSESGTPSMSDADALAKLKLAAERMDLAAAKEVLAKRLDLIDEPVDKCGRSLLMRAIAKPNAEMVSLLVQAGASVDERMDKFRQNAISYAVDKANNDVFKALLAGTANSVEGGLNFDIGRLNPPSTEFAVGSFILRLNLHGVRGPRQHFLD